MTLPHEPFKHLENWKREWERFVTTPSLFNPGYAGPRVDVHETENEVIAVCEIPGLEKKEDIQISVHDDLLNISGNTSGSNAVREEQLYRRERFMGRFQPGFPVTYTNDYTKSLTYQCF